MPAGIKCKAGHHKPILVECASDMAVFKSFLMEGAPHYNKAVPFLNKMPVYNHQLSLYADVAGTASLGMGCFFAGQWRQGQWAETTLFRNNYKPNIALLELLAIVTAVESCGELSGKRILLRSDKQATVAFINRMKTDIPTAMDLLRILTKTCLSFQILVKAEYLPGV